MMYMSNTNLLYALALQNAPNIGDITAKKLIAHCGSPEAVLNEKKQNLLKLMVLVRMPLAIYIKTFYCEC